MRTLIATLVLLAVTGCYRDPLSTNRTDNQSIKVQELFTHNGVTVYRFQDGLNYVYFTSKAGPINYSKSENCGKGCHRQVPVQTIGEL